MKRSLPILVGSFLLSGLGLQAQIITDSVTFTGAMETYTVPCGVTSIDITCYGAQGGDGATGGNSATGGVGGRGGMTSGSLAVTPGQQLFIFVGGAGTTAIGGFNGGGSAGSQNAGGGGGATDVRINSTNISDRIIVAGGGGGGGRAGCETNTVAGGAGGSGNGGNGTNGFDAPTVNGFAGGGAGAISSNGGAAGTGCSGFLGQPGIAAVNEVGGAGGNGQSCCCFNAASIPGGGGGGGGLIGGGGGGGGSAGTTGCSGNDKGAGGGGAGGSAYTGGVNNGVVSTNARTGNGAVYISYVDPAIGTIPSITGNSSVCENSSGTYSIPTIINAGSYTWTAAGATILSGQGTNTVVVNFTTGVAILTVYATNSCNDTSNTAILTINVNSLPAVVLQNTPSTFCLADGPSTLTGGTPAGGVYSGPGVTSGVFTPASAGAGTHTITYTYADANGCVNSANQTITVDPCIGIVENLSNTTITTLPNPATDVLHITWGAGVQVRTVEIMDVNGRVVMTKQVSGTTADIQLEQLATGSYSVRLTEAGTGATKTSSFIKK